MKYIIGLNYVAGPAYLRKALRSIGEKHLPHVRVINSGSPEWNHGETWREITPPVPLSHTQGVNYIFSLGLGCDVVFMQHCDAEAEPDTYDKLLELALGPKFAVAFTNYDSLAMYNPHAWLEVGQWDWRLFPSYYSDCDYHRRLKLSGWQLIDTGLPVKHEGSHIINKIDKRAKYLNHMLLSGFAREAYIRKWGGPPDHETFDKPFNGELENPYPDE